jgi:hypothetical protein
MTTNTIDNLKIGATRNVINTNRSAVPGAPQTKITITNKSGADIIQYSQEGAGSEHINLGFAGAPDMHIGPKLFTEFPEDHYNTAKDPNMSLHAGEDGFITKTGTRAGDTSRDDILYKCDGIEMTVEAAAKMGLVRKVAGSWVEV